MSANVEHFLRFFGVANIPKRDTRRPNPQLPLALSWLNRRPSFRVNYDSLGIGQNWTTGMAESVRGAIRSKCDRRRGLSHSPALTHETRWPEFLKLGNNFFGKRRCGATD